VTTFRKICSNGDTGDDPKKVFFPYTAALVCSCGPDSQIIMFTIGGYQPGIKNAFTPPAENPHAHNVAGRPGFDAQCKPADPVPARFSAICPKCSRGWYYEAEDADLRVNPEMILAGLARMLNDQLKAAIPNPALRLAVGGQIQIHAQRVLRQCGLAELLAEIPARGATKAQEEFCARFIAEEK